LASYAADGGVIWALGFGGGNADRATAVVTDAEGRIYLVGSTAGNVKLADEPILYGHGLDDVLLARLGADGTVEFVTLLGAEGVERARGLALDHAGNVVLAGHYEGAAELGGQPLPGAGLVYDVFVVKLAAGGTVPHHLWSHGFGGAGVSTGWGAAIVADGGVAIAGAFTYDLTIGDAGLDSAADNDVFLALLDP
jgi:hypothetical protein